MVMKKIAGLSGLDLHDGHRAYDFDGHAHLPGMSEGETREFLREEQREGTHPSLRGKRF